MTDRPSVLFVCVHNAGRSQMAAGWLKHLAGDRVDVRSAGSLPADQINPTAVQAMRELDVDITGEQPKLLNPGQRCRRGRGHHDGLWRRLAPYPGKRYEDWHLTDPAGQPVEIVRQVRDEIGKRMTQLLETTLGATTRSAKAEK